MLKFSEIHEFQENESNIPYENHMSQSDEKFRIWERKKFSERQLVFRKVISMSEFPHDMLSIWINEQMDILLANSVVD